MKVAENYIENKEPPRQPKTDREFESMCNYAVAAALDCLSNEDVLEFLTKHPGPENHQIAVFLNNMKFGESDV